MNTSANKRIVWLLAALLLFTSITCRAISRDSEEESGNPGSLPNESGNQVPPTKEPRSIQKEGYIAFTARSGPDQMSASKHLYLIRPGGTGLVDVKGYSYWNDSPSWSPDGKRLTFWSESEGNRDIYVMTLKDLSIKRLTDDPAWDINPSWSADGKQIAFASGRSGNLDIYVMDADGGNQHAVASAETDENYPAWSPDGKQLAFVDEISLNLTLIGANGSDKKILTQASGRPAWSPDGKMLAFAGFIFNAGDAYGQTNNPEIIIHIFADNTYTRLTENPGVDAFPAWSPDGKRLVFESDRDDPQAYTRSLYQVEFKGAPEKFEPGWVTRLTDTEGGSAAWSKPDIETVLPPPVIMAAPPPMIRVCPQGCDFSSIQEAIDSAKGKVNIYVESGTYRENLLVNKTVNLYGEDSGGGQPVIDAGGQPRAVTIEAPNVVMENFKIINTTGDEFHTAAVYVTSAHNSILKNTIAACGDSIIENHAVLLAGSDYNTVSGNTIQDGCGEILLISSSNNLINLNLMDGLINLTTDSQAKEAGLSEQLVSPRFNIVTENSAAGVYLDQKVHENRVVLNTISGGFAGDGEDEKDDLFDGAIVLNCGPSLNVVAANEISNGAGITLMSAGAYNMILRNGVKNCANGVTLDQSFYELVYGNQISGSSGTGIFSGMASGISVPGIGVGGGHLIFANDLRDNSVNARDDSGGPPAGLPDMWDNGSIGNHFSDFDETPEGCADKNNDLICDEPRPIPEQDGVMDHFPLVEFTVVK